MERRSEKPTLALVDDSDEVRALVRNRLQLSELFDIVGEGRDGTEAISIAYRYEPSLMLLDISMPAMDGLEALPAILTLSPDTKVVMFTGFEERGLARRAREDGASGYIEKSLPIDELGARLLAFLGQESERPSADTRRLRAVDADVEGLAEDQAVLNEHLERFREVFDQAAIGMATLTLTGDIVRGNAALAEMMQCEQDDLVGIDYGQLSEGRGDDLDEGLRLIREEGWDLASFEHTLPLSEQRFVRVTLAPIRDSKRQPLYVFAQIQDISAQRHAEDELRRIEERFRLLVTAVKDYAIYMLDPEGHVVSWNAGAQGIKGYAADEIIGQHFRVFYPTEEQESRHPEQNLEAALRDGSYAEEGWRIRKDGSRFWASVVITAVYDDEGRHVGFAKVTRDQTEQRRHAEQTQQAVEQQARLLDVTAHELRSPTAVVAGSASMLLDTAARLGEAQRTELLSAIATSGRRLQRIADDLGTASSLQRDSLRLHPASTTLSATLATAVESLHAAHPRIEVDLELGEDGDFVADVDRIGQALDNLLANAVRHGAAPITVSGRLSPETVTIAVSDAGPGVRAELLPSLFEKFAIAGPTGGTGLGLYLVREIARQHGGEATYRPAADGAAHAFELVLPRRGPGEPA